MILIKIEQIDAQISQIKKKLYHKS